MEAKNIISFQYEKEDRIYSLQMPGGAPLGEAYEASANFLSEIVRLINEHTEKAVPKELGEIEEKSKSDD